MFRAKQTRLFLSSNEVAAWLVPACPSLLFVNGAGEFDQKHDQDLRDTCVMLLDRAGCDLLTICDITGHSYRSAQTIVNYRCGHFNIVPDDADCWSDELRISDIEDKFVCTACGKRGADVRPDWQSAEQIFQTKATR